MNCPTCGRVPLPRAKQCLCGELLAWPAAPVKGNRPMHPLIARRLNELGFERQPDETPEAFRERCRRYVLDRYAGHREHAA